MSPPEDKKRKLGRGLSALLGEEEGSSVGIHVHGISDDCDHIVDIR